MGTIKGFSLDKCKITGACEQFNIRVNECEPNIAEAPFSMQSGETKKIKMFFHSDFESYKS